MPAKLTYRVRTSRQYLAVSTVSGEGMHHALRNDLLPAQLLDNQIAAVAHVNHHRQRGRPAQFQVPIKILLLERHRRVIPIAIQPRFADRSHSRIGRELLDDFPVTRLGLRG